MEKNYETDVISAEIKDLLSTVNNFLFDYEEFALMTKEAMLSLSNNN